MCLHHVSHSQVCSERLSWPLHRCPPLHRLWLAVRDSQRWRDCLPPSEAKEDIISGKDTTPAPTMAISTTPELSLGSGIDNNTFVTSAPNNWLFRIHRIQRQLPEDPEDSLKIFNNILHRNVHQSENKILSSKTVSFHRILCSRKLSIKILNWMRLHFPWTPFLQRGHSYFISMSIRFLNQIYSKLTMQCNVKPERGDDIVECPNVVFISNFYQRMGANEPASWAWSRKF